MKFKFNFASVLFLQPSRSQDADNFTQMNASRIMMDLIFFALTRRDVDDQETLTFCSILKVLTAVFMFISGGVELERGRLSESSTVRAN